MTDQEKPADKSPPPPPPPYDATLDLRSDQFDPLKALYATSMQLPHPNATIFDNIGKFESWLNADKLKKNDGTTRPKVAENDEPIFERRFLPHQSMQFTFILMPPSSSLCSCFFFCSDGPGCRS